MGLKPSHGELNADLRPAHTKDAHLIHDDLIVATNSHKGHVKVIDEIMWAIYKAGLTWNPIQCQFGRKTISSGSEVWYMEGMGSDQIHPMLSLSHDHKTELVWSVSCVWCKAMKISSPTSPKDCQPLKGWQKNSLNVLRYTNKVLIN